MTASSKYKYFIEDSVIAVSMQGSLSKIGIPVKLKHKGPNFRVVYSKIH